MLRAKQLLGQRLLLGAMTLALGLSLPACKKGGKGSRKPGQSKADIERAVEEAKQEAKVAGLIEVANKDLANGRYVSAAKRAEEALAENPNNADAHAVLGAAQWRAGDFEGSTEAYKKAIELDSDNYGAGLGLARNLQAAGRHQEALAVLDAVLAQDKTQVDPNLAKLASYYAVCDADRAVEVLDEVFKRLPAEDPRLPLVQAFAGFIRPLQGKGPLCQVSGTSGSSDANIDHNVGMKYTGATVGDEFARVIFFEIREESIIDDELAKQLGLKPVGKFIPPGQSEEAGIVIVPKIQFGDLSLENVPAIVQSLEPYEAAMGERPGLILGRQALQSLGAITFDFPNKSLTLSKDVPASAPAGAAEAPLILVSTGVVHAPAVPIRLEGSDHEFYVYFGGVYRAGLAVTRKHYLKSGKLPRELDDVDDPDAGLKMVYIDGLKIGSVDLPGVGGLVLVNNPPDQNLGGLIEATAFELGGYVNTALMETWKVTYSIPSGKIFIQASG